MRYDEKALRKLIATHSAPRSETGGSGRFAEFHRLIQVREQHFSNRPEADQTLPEPHDTVSPYQSDVLRRTWVTAKSRLEENPFRIRATPPRDTDTMQKAADDFEKAMNRLFDLVQERGQFSIQGDCADGQLVDGLAWIHWHKAMDVWDDAKFPDAQTTNDLPVNDPAEAARYREALASDNLPQDQQAKYVETDGSRQQRDTQAKARAGVPWHVEVPHPSTISYETDRSCLNGYGLIVWQREVAFMEYAEQLAAQDGIFLTKGRQAAIRVASERPADWDPSGGSTVAWGMKAIVTEVWTRDEYYELITVDRTNDGFKLVKSFEHPYGMPPFASVRADHFNHPDPALAHLPTMQGIYALKPFVDRDMTLGRAIAEQIALPFYYVKLSDGSWMTNDSGQKITWTKNALAAEALPPGAEIVAISPELNPAFIEFLKLTGEELKESIPHIGQIEVSASTQPWAIRMQQEEANVPIKGLLKSQVAGIRTCARNIQYVMSLPLEAGGFGRSVPIRMENGQIIDLQPEEFRDHVLEVDINPTSGAMQISKIEHLRGLLDDPLVPYTQDDFLEQALEVEDVEQAKESWYAQKWFDEYVAPGFMKQKVAEHFGAEFVVGPDGMPVNSQGVSVTPEQVLSGQGYNVQQPPAPPIPPGVNGATPPTVMPSMPTIAAPGTMPVAGMAG